jgi:SEC-C motif
MRRNAPCHCGSGKRFKHCHGRFDAENLLQRQRFEAAQRQRRLQQGFGKPIQSYLLRDSRAVIVGRALMIGKGSTFTDFLLEYFAERIGPQWIASEMRLGDAAHPIAQWAVEMNRDRRSQPAGIGVVKRKVNNASRSLLSAAYNLYLIEHHYEQYDQPLLERLLNRLRVKEGFFATVSETNAAAAFLKAGFVLEYENDLLPGRHAEFTAIDAVTDRHFSVEVKTRSGPDDASDSKRRLKLKNKLSQALKKKLPWMRVVFIDLNIPEIITDFDHAVLIEIMAQVGEAEATLKVNGAPAPPAYLFLINQPFHYNLSSMEGAPLIGALGFKLDTFQPRTEKFGDVIRAREHHPEMYRLIESMRIHSEPPSTFDGEHPEFAFDPQAGQSRWLIGNQYLVPGPRDKEVFATLRNATAVNQTKTMHGVFEADGIHFMVQAPMSDADLAAYMRSPETFFGVVQDVGRNANNAYELAEFFYGVYKDTEKEKLLEFLKDHPSIESLRKLSQQDLAVFVSEQWALSAEAKARESKQKGSENPGGD